ncbi:ArgR family transcriptional regulator [Paludibacteraceae bacterium OttesenSCG-928-F17]|nr:ArgR family transcriptional regulator [Paludibacteraceae bacterium OttesenSCG-928-F17]
MKNKRKRLQIISDLLRTSVIGSQEELLNLLHERECDVTQATLSRDLKQLKVAKTPLANGTYKYILPPVNSPVVEHGKPNHFSNGIIVSIDFTGQFAVIKTKPGYANVVAWDIDNEAKHEVLGTIAGDDTILVIIREGISRHEVIDILNITFAEEK